MKFISIYFILILMGILICPPLCLARKPSGLYPPCTKDADCKFPYICSKPNGSDSGHCSSTALQYFIPTNIA